MRLRLLVAFALVLVLAPIARAGELSQRYRAGQWIAAGTFKSAWTVIDGRTGRQVPGKVLVTVERTEPWDDVTVEKIKSMLKDEKAQLDWLKANGVPVVQFDQVGTYEGKPAAIENAYAISNRQWMTWNGDEAAWRQDMSPADHQSLALLNGRSLTSIQKIRTALASSGLSIRDPQVLVARDGSIVIADPLEVEENSANAEVYGTRVNTMLDLLAAQAQRQIAARGGRLNFAIPSGDAGPDATEEQLASFAADVERAGGTVRRADPGELADGIHAQTLLEDAMPVVVLPPLGEPVKHVALLDELHHVETIAATIAVQGVDQVRRIFDGLAHGEESAVARVDAWEADAKRFVLGLIGRDHPARPAVERALSDLESRPKLDPLRATGLSTADAEAIRTRGEAPSPGVVGALGKVLEGETEARLGEHGAVDR